LLWSGLAAESQAQCTNNLTSLNGKYTFGGHGDQFQLLGLLDFPLVDAGYLTLDGSGHVTSGKIFEDLNGTDQTLTESGNYTLNADCSYTFSLSGTQSRRFNLEAVGVDPTTGIAAGGVADDVDNGNDISLSFESTSDPAGGCVQGDLAQSFAGSLAGVNPSGQRSSGDLLLNIDANGDITGSGHESDQGTNRADTVTGNVTVNSDCTFSGSLTLNGTTEPWHGLVEAAGSQIPTAPSATQLSPAQSSFPRTPLMTGPWHSELHMWQLDMEPRYPVSF
jgi:hypothetical protein